MVELLLVYLISCVSSLLSRWLMVRKNFSPVRASSVATLVLLIPLLASAQALAAAALGGSFLGITDVDKLSLRGLILAGVFYSLIWVFVLPFNRDFGGALGTAALTSILLAIACVKLLESRKKTS